MDYKKIYDNLMESRLLLKEERIKLKRSRKGYFEAHHIVPKSMGGGGQTNGYRCLKHQNIIILTAREHYIAHALLWLIHRNRETAWAFKSMCTLTNNRHERNYVVSSRMYEAVRSDLTVSEETRRKISASSLGKKLTIEQKEKMRRSHLGKKMSDEARENMRKANLGRKASQETREKMRQAHKGKKKTPEHIEKVRLANLGKKIPQEIVDKQKETTRKKFLIKIEEMEKMGFIRTNYKTWVRKDKPPRTLSLEAREKIRIHNLGKKQSQETIAKREETKKRNRLLGITKKYVPSPETTAKRIESRKRNRLLGITKKYVTSQETKEKQRKSNLGKKMSPEAKEKIRQTKLGKKLSPETKAKISETIKRNKLLKLAQQQETQNN
jgi:uncharacterized membrane protein